MAPRARGKVKWFNGDKGYGFITQDNGPDLFVHYSEIRGSGYRTLNEGDVVEFDITDGKKGKQASAVTVVQG
ncbi:MAG: cold-shock protein CspA [Chloroflexota bacterium]|jgi:CspA family cold shock protein|nr:MAG: cold-shock protein CspA [Chloroflexota bacterium]